MAPSGRSRYSTRNLIRWRPNYKVASLAPAAYYAGRAVRSAINRSNTRTMTRGRRQPTGLGVNTQHDRKLIYRRRRMPYYRRRRWKSYVRKVHAVAEKDLGSRTILFNNQLTFGQTTDGNDNIFDLELYSQSSTDSWRSDLYNISGYENVNANPTHAAGDDIPSASKFLFQSAVLDITFRNGSTYNSGGSTNLDSRAKMEVDVYEMSVRRDATDTTSNYAGLYSLFNDANSNTLNIGGAGTGLAIDQRGVTPWELPLALSRWKMKIWKKTKFMVPNGDTFTYQVRDPKRRVATQESLQKTGGFNRVGWTKILFFKCKLVPGCTLGTTDGTYQNNAYVGCTRKYMYKIEGVKEDRDRYISL